MNDPLQASAVGTLWLTGLSSAGKSTLARALKARMNARGIGALLLDGDELRAGLSHDLGFSVADRAEQIRRTAEVARLANDSGLWAIAALITPTSADRQRACRIVGPASCHLIWVHAPLEVCEARDVKGLYRRARSGLLENFTGVGAAYEDAHEARVRLDTSRFNVSECVSELWKLVAPSSVRRRALG